MIAAVYLGLGVYLRLVCGRLQTCLDPDFVNAATDECTE